MYVVCVICSDLLLPSDDAVFTSCGHVFHRTCLIQWLERSKTCPQCHERTTKHTIHKICFSFSKNDSIIENYTSLRNECDNLTSQLKLKDEEISNLIRISEQSQTQEVELIRENRHMQIYKMILDENICAPMKQDIEQKNQDIANYEKEIEDIYALMRQCKQKDQDIANYKKEIEQLKKAIEKKTEK